MQRGGSKGHILDKRLLQRINEVGNISLDVYLNYKVGED